MGALAGGQTAAEFSKVRQATAGAVTEVAATAGR